MDQWKLALSQLTLSGPYTKADGDPDFAALAEDLGTEPRYVKLWYEGETAPRPHYQRKLIKMAESEAGFVEMSRRRLEQVQASRFVI